MSDKAATILAIAMLITSIIIGYSLQNQEIDLGYSDVTVHVRGVDIPSFPSSLDITHHPNTESNRFPISVSGYLSN